MFYYLHTSVVCFIGEGGQGQGLVVMVVLGHPGGEDPVLHIIGGLGTVHPVVYCMC